MKALKTQGYETPTPIQAEAIPSLIEGRDLVGIAQTGTGKTAAFVLPIPHRLGGDPKPAPRRACKTLILAPTRELAAQIFESAKSYGHFMRPRTALVVGGVKPGPQVRSLEHGVDILVATPGRLLDHLGTGALRLTGVRTVVLDEADQMMDMGFIPAIRKIMEKVPKTRQTVLLSATMPKQIRALATDFLTDPAEVSVAPESQPIERIEQLAVHLPAQDKRAFLIDFLKETDVDRAIVFTRTKHGADRVMRSLESTGIKSAAIHGNKTQAQRERALKFFKAGKTSVLVATDIAARGIDIDDVSHVINYELPNVPEAYVHRIGRTARAGREGVAVSLCAPDEFGLLMDIERKIGMEVPGDGRPEHAPQKTASKTRNGNRRRGGPPRRRNRRPGEKRKKSEVA